MPGVTREIVRRASELASLASCALNVIFGTGDREVTLSAGAWELRRRGSGWGSVLVSLIDAFNRPFDGADHCARAWEEHAAIWTKVAAD